jgi:hypothetical protein
LGGGDLHVAADENGFWGSCRAGGSGCGIAKGDIRDCGAPCAVAVEKEDGREIIPPTYNRAIGYVLPGILDGFGVVLGVRGGAVN